MLSPHLSPAHQCIRIALHHLPTPIQILRGYTSRESRSYRVPSCVLIHADLKPCSCRMVCIPHAKIAATPNQHSPLNTSSLLPFHKLLADGFLTQGQRHNFPQNPRTAVAPPPPPFTASETITHMVPSGQIRNHDQTLYDGLRTTPGH